MRDLFVSTEVLHAVTPPWPRGRERRQHIVFRETLDRFTSGDVLSVAEDPIQKPSYAVMARTNPIEKEIWDFRCMTEDDGIRCFGGFGDKDLFIALTWNFRDNISRFSQEVLECRREWDRLFGKIPPFRAREIEKYGTNFVAV